jgi:hypothetical protein
MPTYSPAFSGLANAYNSKHIAFPGFLPDETRIAQALGYAQEAVRLDPVNSRAQLCLAWSYAMARQAEEAAVHAELARELNDNDAWTNISSITCLRVCGKHDIAARLLVHANLEHEHAGPLGWAYYAINCFLVGDLAACIEAGERAGDSFELIPALLAAAHALAGAPARASMEADRFRRRIRTRWQGETDPSDDEIARWLASTMPIQNAQDLQRWRDGLKAAGLAPR